MGWNTTWPWGKKSPVERLADLSETLDRVLLRRKVFEDRVIERRAELERQEQALKHDMDIARGCLDDARRLEAKEILYRLSNRGIDRFDRVPAQGRVSEDTLKMLQEELKEVERRLGPAREDEEDIEGREDLVSAADMKEVSGG